MNSYFESIYEDEYDQFKFQLYTKFSKLNTKRKNIISKLLQIKTLKQETLFNCRLANQDATTNNRFNELLQEEKTLEERLKNEIYFNND